MTIFGKTPIEVCIPHLYASFGTFWKPNWSIIWGTVNLWSLFENRQIAVVERKCRRNRNYSECFKTHCTVPRIIDQFGRKGPKRSVKMWTTNFYKIFLLNLQFCIMLLITVFRTTYFLHILSLTKRFLK